MHDVLQRPTAGASTADPGLRVLAVGAGADAARVLQDLLPGPGAESEDGSPVLLVTTDVDLAAQVALGLGHAVQVTTGVVRFEAELRDGAPAVRAVPTGPVVHVEVPVPRETVALTAADLVADAGVPDVAVRRPAPPGRPAELPSRPRWLRMVSEEIAPRPGPVPEASAVRPTDLPGVARDGVVLLDLTWRRARGPRPVPVAAPVPEPAPEVVDEPVVAPVIPVAPVVPVVRQGERVLVGAPEPGDVEVVQIRTGWTYTVAQRRVTEVLAVHPGLRRVTSSAEAQRHLVSLQAYLAQDAAVDAVLRGWPDPDGGAVELARTAAAGLRSLPTAIGPSVCAAPGGEQVLDRYRDLAAAGAELLEPGFLAASRSGQVPAGDDADELLVFALHGRSSRQVKLLRPEGYDVLFAPGSRWRVLQVSGPIPGIDRVVGVIHLQQSSAGSTPPAPGERALARMTTLLEAVSVGAAPATQNVLVGLVGVGTLRPHRLPETPRTPETPETPEIRRSAS